MRVALLLLLLLILCAPSAAHAQVEGNPAHWCRNGFFTDASAGFRLAKAVGDSGARVHFYDDAEGCPSMSEKCRKKAYVIPGDQLIAAQSFGDWVCVWYQPRKGSETVGWIPEHMLSLSEPDKRPTAARWVGAWEFYKNSLDIGRGARAGELSVKGDAIWQGIGDNVHVGSLGGRARPDGNVLTIEDDICRIKLTLVGPYLLADDNNECGGVNVSFDGVYQRRPPAPTRRQLRPGSDVRKGR